ncbi:MAG TPA: hypothetical protein VK861_02340, partial [Bacteroidales bacterium]|nr:hypothetical protein [Bacteroidales bacterium]
FDKGTLLSSNWHKINLLSDMNCFWDTRTENIMFADLNFSEWRKAGRDRNSIIADPLFRDPGQYDFRFRSNSVTRKIKFEPFDYSQTGVYGSDEWKKMAEPDPEMLTKFDSAVESLEAVRKK